MKSPTSCSVMEKHQKKLPPSLWWQSLDESVECAITLEPINALPYPPFILQSTRQDSKRDNNDVLYYFDGHALASYIVSRGIFQNPLTREKLSYADCQRLDQYLDDYGDFTNFTFTTKTTTRQFGVLEAFALRESVQVRDHIHNNINNPAMEESRQRRADFLRSEATAALSGLFEYGSSSRGRQQRSDQQQQPTRSYNTATRNHHANNTTTPPTLGFDLYRLDPSNDNQNNDDDDGYGMVVIDDDDAVRVESEQSHYQELQEAFPRLSTQEQQTDQNNNVISVDERALQQIRDQAEQDRLQQLVRQQALEHARKQLEKEALQRKQQRKQAKEMARIETSELVRQQQREQEERDRARAEIEKWREAQWERLRQRAEQEQAIQREQERIAALQQQQQEKEKQEAERQRKEQKEKAAKEEEDDPEAKQKAAKAAKKKRAKERKKAQKALERQEQEKRDKEAALKAQREASATKCAHCQGGILGCGFEKFGHQFCSPKCARVGPAT